MRPAHHAAAGLAGGAGVLLLTGSVGAALAFALVSVLLDLDHVADYLAFGVPPRTVHKFFTPGHSGIWGRTVFLLHSHELLLTLLLFWAAGAPPLWAKASIVGLAGHLALDEWGNRRRAFHLRLPALYYFFLYRLARGFRGEALLIPKY